MSDERNNTDQVRELRNPRAPRSRSFRVIRKVRVPVAKWVKRKKSDEGSKYSSISSYIPFVFLIASVIGLLQVDDLFESHPANMWISEAALVIFCLSHATMKKIINQITNEYGTTRSWSQIIETFRVLSGTLVLVSLSSIFLPHRLWWLLFVIWALLTFIVIAHHHHFFMFTYTWVYKEIIKAFHSICSMSNKFTERAHHSADRCFA